MSHLFYHLIHQEKTKLWLMSLERLENTPAVNGKTLATALDCTVRTIQTDIKQIKDYFGSSILLLGDEEGYHLSFQSPIVYTKKKQALLEAEPLFVYADQLLAGTHRTNQEWASYFSVSLASFGRIKRSFVHILKQEYQVTIRGMDNRLYGKEAALFLLALQEEQFLNPLKQKAFFHQFSCVPAHRFPMMDFEQVTAYFFEAWLTLMGSFFQLAP